MTPPGSIVLDAVGRRRGRSVEVTLTAQIPAGTHIEPHVPTEPTLIPTEVEVEVEGLEAAAVDYPEPVRKDLGFRGMALSVYEGTVRFVIRGEVAAGVEVVRGTVSYQPCVGGACLPPRSSTWEAMLKRPQEASSTARGAVSVGPSRNRSRQRSARASESMVARSSAMSEERD